MSIKLEIEIARVHTLWLLLYSTRYTEIRYKAGPRLRDLASWHPSGRGGEFTQPRAHLIAGLCTQAYTNFVL